MFGDDDDREITVIRKKNYDMKVEAVVSSSTEEHGVVIWLGTTSSAIAAKRAEALISEIKTQGTQSARVH